MKNRTIYMLPGRGGLLDKGLGAELQRRGYKVVGRELRGDFQRLPFADQLGHVADDLRKGFWHEDARVIANSFGAYLFLHAQTLLPPFAGRALLLSPIVGEASNEEQMMFFVPPRAGRIQDMVDSGMYPTPTCCEIHVGEHDWQSVPENVMWLAERLQFKFSIVPGAGHQLPQEYVSSVLDGWLI
ncbi:MAG TPA: hypothetical protein PK034_03420 [Rugosibacter sp.]|nr:hypothetical protein [Rugosibacter sp.]